MSYIRYIYTAYSKQLNLIFMTSNEKQKANIKMIVTKTYGNNIVISYKITSKLL